jgi:hypothetical protein
MDDEICEHTEQQVNICLEQKINKKIYITKSRQAGPV